MRRYAAASACGIHQWETGRDHQPGPHSHGDRDGRGGDDRPCVHRCRRPPRGPDGARRDARSPRVGPRRHDRVRQRAGGWSPLVPYRHGWQRPHADHEGGGQRRTGRVVLARRRPDRLRALQLRRRARFRHPGGCRRREQSRRVFILVAPFSWRAAAPTGQRLAPHCGLRAKRNGIVGNCSGKTSYG